ncbi:FxSxx-COOH system tetratricopeptide repeat protein [Microbispora sp. H10830]|uniref:FxSxx-COOH system tetratricopeptide repeat protein n=1 Tax=Microbispora sp. H10830 TaxID=2729109 RepID=UPI002872FCF8|nr:FxSxx-COOH system tetratricopeptide repeat protein [Microbispora sp. H10830]
MPALQNPGPEPRIWGSRIPLRNANFTGRETALSELRTQMFEGPTAILPHTLRGMGGVGKTQLVIEYAHRFKGDYDVVWWIASDIPLLIPGSLGALAEKLGLPAAKVVGIDEACRSVLDALRRGEPYKRWLLIFDNVNKAQDIMEMIPAGRPEQGHVLITSRNPRWEGVANTLVIDVFAREESVEFLGKRAGRMRPEDARRLAHELGDLPLALEQAGALQVETGMSTEEYLDLLRRQPIEVMDENQPMEYPRSMTAAWRLSINALEDQLPEALQLLRCAAFFGPEPIPIDLFRWGSSGAGPLLSPILGNPILRTRALRSINNFALGRIDDRAIQIHRLVQRLLRADIGPDRQEEYEREAQTLLAAARRLPPEDETNWGAFSRLVPHLDPVGTAKTTDGRLRDLALNVVRYLYLIGDTESARTFASSFRDNWSRISGMDDYHVLVAEYHLGNSLRQDGRYDEAFTLVEETLARARRVLDGDDDVVLQLINAFGADLRAKGMFREAVAHDEDSRRRHAKKYGDTDLRTLRTMNNLALSYALISDYTRAVELQTTVNEVYNRPGAVTKLSLLISWGGLCQAVRLSGEYQAAHDLGVDALDYGRSEVGANHLRTLAVAVDLAIAMRRLGRIEDALELAHDTYHRYESIVTAGHPQSISAAISLANALRTNGQVDEALELAEDIAERLPRIYGNDHPFTLGALGNLALLRRVTGDPAGARTLDEEVLGGLDKVLGRKHHYSLTVAIDLANDLHELGEHEAALDLDRQTYAQLQELLGAEHPMTLGSAANLANSLETIGKTEEADALRAATLAHYDRTLGARHPDAVLTRAGGRLDFDFDPPQF